MRLLGFCRRLIVGMDNEDRTVREAEEELVAMGYRVAGRVEVAHPDPRLARWACWAELGCQIEDFPTLQARHITRAASTYRPDIRPIIGRMGATCLTLTLLDPLPSTGRKDRTVSNTRRSGAGLNRLAKG